jgi:hypothetical protein
MALKLSWYEPPKKVIHMEEHFSALLQAAKANRMIREAQAAIGRLPEDGEHIVSLGNHILPVLAEIPFIAPQLEDRELLEIEAKLAQISTQMEETFPWLKGADDGERKL